MSDFHIRQQSTSNRPRRARRRGRRRPEVCPAPGRSGQRRTCLIGMALPLPMLSARLSTPFFSLSGSLPFRDCKTKIKLASGKGRGSLMAVRSAPIATVSANMFRGHGYCIRTNPRACNPGSGLWSLWSPRMRSFRGEFSKLFHCKIIF